MNPNLKFLALIMQRDPRSLEQTWRQAKAFRKIEGKSDPACYHAAWKHFGELNGMTCQAEVQIADNRYKVLSVGLDFVTVSTLLTGKQFQVPAFYLFSQSFPYPTPHATPP